MKSVDGHRESLRSRRDLMKSSWCSPKQVGVRVGPLGMERRSDRDRLREQALGPLAMEWYRNRDRRRVKALGPLAGHSAPRSHRGTTTLDLAAPAQPDILAARGSAARSFRGLPPVGHAPFG